MSPVEVVQTISSAGVGVVGLDLKRTVVVLRSVIDDQEVGETEVVIQVRLDPFLPIDITLNPMA